MARDQDTLQYICPVCDTLKYGDEILRCSACKDTLYCSAECQRKDWTRHKPHCRATKAFEDRIESEALANPNPILPLDLMDRLVKFVKYHQPAFTIAMAAPFGITSTSLSAPDLLGTHLLVLEFDYNFNSHDNFDLLILEQCYLQSRADFLLTPLGKSNSEEFSRAFEQSPKNSIGNPAGNPALVVPLVKSKGKGGQPLLLPIIAAGGTQREGFMRIYVSHMVLKSLQWAVKGPVCLTLWEANYRSSLREARWGIQPHAIHDTFRADQIIIPPSFLPDSRECPVHISCRSTPPATLEFDKPVAASPHSIRFLVESALREIMAKQYMGMYAARMVQSSQSTAIELKLGEAFIIESLVELSGQISTPEQLMEFFNAERIEAGLVNLSTLLSETRYAFALLEGVGVKTAIREIQRELGGHGGCLAGVFTERTLLQLEIARRSPSKSSPNAIPATPNSKSSSTSSDSPSVGPSLFDRVKLLIARGELKGSAWKSRSTWVPLLTSVLKSFHQSLKDVFLDLNDKAPHPVRDLLKYHPSPLSLFFQDHDSAPGLVAYAYTGGHEKAVELNVATEIELGLDSAARKEMAIAVSWLDQLDVTNSTMSFNDRNSIAKAAQGLDKNLFPESAKTKKNREKKAKKLAKREDEIKRE